MFNRSYYSPYSFLIPTNYYSPYSSYLRNYSYACRPFYPYCRYPCASICPSRCSRIEYIPFQKSYIDYIPQTRIQYIPCQRACTDYVEVQHDIDYVPVPRVEKYIEYQPQERYYTNYDYQPIHRSTVLPKRQSMYDEYQTQYPLHNSFGYNNNGFNQQDNMHYVKHGAQSDSDHGIRNTTTYEKKNKKNKKKKSDSDEDIKKTTVYEEYQEKTKYK